MKFAIYLLLAAVLSFENAWAGPTGTATDTAQSNQSTTAPIHDPTSDLLQGLSDMAQSVAEKASVGLHQADLNQAMSVPGMVSSGVVRNERQAILVRVGMAYSDFGKLQPYKNWLTKADGGAIRPEGVTNASKELYAILQGADGAIWNDPELKGRKEFYAPLLKMMGGPVINPQISHEQVLKLTGATVPLPGTTIQIPKYPMIIGYLHEWQGVMQSYIDADKAIRENKGPLAGTVRNLDDYRQVFDSIYGHNGSGPSREEYTAWFKKKYNREPHKTEMPFWTIAHEIVQGDAAKAEVPIFENSLQSKKYAGSEKPNKLSMFHRIMDRIDGSVQPDKIYAELAHLGPRDAMIESYYGGNYHGPVHTQEFTAEYELDRMVEKGIINRDEAEILKRHAYNQIPLAKIAFDERAKKTRFYQGDKLVPIEKVGQVDPQTITHVELDTAAGTRRFQFATVADASGNKRPQVLDENGKVIENFMDLFKKEVAHPATEAAKRDPRWTVGGGCGYAEL